jgi:hypothetical protein
MRTLHILSDKHSMLLPFPVLLQSHIQKRKKFVLLGLLALGVFITIIQVIRIRTVKNLANYLDSASLILWSTVENNMGIISRYSWTDHRQILTVHNNSCFDTHARTTLQILRRKNTEEQLRKPLAVVVRF